MPATPVLLEHPRRYRGWQQIALHGLFWLLAFGLEALQTRLTFRRVDALFLAVTLREILTVMAIFYGLTYLAIPHGLLRGRWLLFGGALLSAYVFLLSSHYFTFYLLRQKEWLPAQLELFAGHFLAGGWLATLTNPLKVLLIIRSYPSLLLALLFKLSSDFYAFRTRQLQLEQEKLQAAQENTRLELNALKNQLNPRFFFGTIGHIQSRIAERDAPAADILARLARLMRYSLYETTQDTIPLVRELRFLSDYVALEKIRHREHVSITLQVHGQPDGLAIPALVLVTFVENAFKHGVNQSIAASWVRITVVISGNQLDFGVENSKPEKLRGERSTGGIGIANVRRRLDLLYPGAYTLRIQNEAEWYQLHLHMRLPAHTGEATASTPLRIVHEPPLPGTP